MKDFLTSPIVKKVAWILLIIGGLNRGLLGLFNRDIVSMIFGYGFFARLVYVIIGLATVHVLLYPASKTHTPLRS